jgi:two-component system OmpR family response regulator
MRCARSTPKMNHVVIHRVFHTTAAAHSLLDFGLPGMSGINSLKASRVVGNKVPVLILTACDALELRVEGLDVCADDYVLKLFDVPELLARIRAVLRRKAGYAVSRLGDDSLDLDLGKRTLCCNGVTSVLSAR